MILMKQCHIIYIIPIRPYVWLTVDNRSPCKWNFEKKKNTMWFSAKQFGNSTDIFRETNVGNFIQSFIGKRSNFSREKLFSEVPRAKTFIVYSSYHGKFDKWGQLSAEISYSRLYPFHWRGNWRLAAHLSCQSWNTTL